MSDRPLEGITVVSFESRLAEETADLIEKQGGRAISAPSMQEIPLERHHDVLAFGERLFRGDVDVLILLTGVGTRMLVEALETKYDLDAILARLDETILLARGPKPVRALRVLGLQADLKVPEPNTWRELVELVDSAEVLQPVAGKRFAVQEYGVSNEKLVEALRARGAEVEQVSIYRWEFPDDLSPLRRGMEAVIDRTAQIALFTSRTQVDHLMELAEKEGKVGEVKRALTEAFVGSIGPVCTEGLRSYGIEPDFEPKHPKLGVLIRDLAGQYFHGSTA